MRLKILLLSLSPLLCIAESTVPEGSHLPTKTEALMEAENIPNVFTGTSTGFTDKDTVAGLLQQKITGYLDSPFEGKSTLVFEGRILACGDTAEVFTEAKEPISVVFMGLRAGNALFRLSDEDVEVSLRTEKRVVKEHLLSVGHFISSDGWLLADMGKLQGLEKEQLKIYFNGLEFPCQLLNANPELGLAILKAPPLANVKFPFQSLCDDLHDGSPLFAQEKLFQGPPLVRLFLNEDHPSPAIESTAGCLILDENNRIVFVKTQKDWVSAKGLRRFLKDYGDFTQGTPNKEIVTVKIFRKE